MITMGHAGCMGLELATQRLDHRDQGKLYLIGSLCSMILIIDAIETVRVLEAQGSCGVNSKGDRDTRE